MRFLLLADPAGKLCREFRTCVEREGLLELK